MAAAYQTMLAYASAHMPHEYAAAQVCIAKRCCPVLLFMTEHKAAQKRSISCQASQHVFSLSAQTGCLVSCVLAMPALLARVHSKDLDFQKLLYGCFSIYDISCNVQGWQPETRTFNTAIIACNMCNQSAQALQVSPSSSQCPSCLSGYSHGYLLAS